MSFIEASNNNNIVGRGRAKSSFEYNPSSKPALRQFVNQPHIKAKLLFAEGHTYYLDEKNGNIIFLPGGSDENIMAIALHKRNLPNERFYGKDLHMAARIFMVAYDVIGPAMKKRAEEGGHGFVSFVIDTNAKSVRGYVSHYTFDKTKNSWDYVRRSVETGFEIKDENKVFERIDKIKESKFETERAYEESKEIKKQENEGE